MDGIDRLDGFGFPYFSVLSVFHSHIGSHLNTFVWLGKIGKDIRRLVLTFVSLVIVSSHFFHGSTVISCLAKVIHACARSLYSLLLSDIFCLSWLFVFIKVSCRLVT